MKGRPFVSNDDVKKVADDVLRHRIILSYQAEADGKQVAEDIIRPHPRSIRPVAKPMNELSRDIIAEIRKIEVVTRRLVNQQMAGHYQSVFKGRRHVL